MEERYRGSHGERKIKKRDRREKERETRGGRERERETGVRER